MLISSPDDGMISRLISPPSYSSRDSEEVESNTRMERFTSMRSFAAKAQALLKRFRKDEDGAMTVEWVAIAAAVVVGAVAITYTVLNNLDPVAGAVGKSLTDTAKLAPAGPPDFMDGQAGS